MSVCTIPPLLLLALLRWIVQDAVQVKEQWRVSTSRDRRVIILVFGLSLLFGIAMTILAPVPGLALLLLVLFVIPWVAKKYRAKISEHEDEQD